MAVSLPLASFSGPHPRHPINQTLSNSSKPITTPSIPTFKNSNSDPNAETLKFCRMGNLKQAMASISNPTSIALLNPDTYCSVLQRCADHRSLRDGAKAHSVISSSGTPIDGLLVPKLVFMYAKCGDLSEARRVFDEMGDKDHTYTWNLLLSEYAKAGQFEESISLFGEMWRLSQAKPDPRTFSCAFKCFGNAGRSREGEVVHGYVGKLGLDGWYLVGNALVGFYSKCSRIESAINMFDEMVDRDVVSWNSIISGCVSNGVSRKAMELFAEMWFSGVIMDFVTLLSVLPACAEMGTLTVGKAVHSYSIKYGYYKEEMTLSNAMIDMYLKCGDLDCSRRLFERMGEKCVVTWTSMISGYTRNGRFEEAIALFGTMESEGIKPDLHAVTSVLHACSCNASLEHGKYVHEFVTRKGLETNLFIANALMDMYAKCGDMEAARLVFDQLDRKDIVSWNTMIGGYSRNCLPNEALDLFSKMQSHMRPDSMTMACVLPASASLSLFDKGRELHGHILRSGYSLDGHVGNALVNMYTKCGSLAIARLIFDRISTKDIISWTVMITGYGMHGQGRDAISVFKEMRSRGVKPDSISFIAILYSCSHSGLVEEGWRFFNIMKNEYKIEPTLEHYACMVDLLSRAGRLTKAYSFIESMPIEPDSTIWGALLCGCRLHRDVKLAEKVAERVFELEPENTGYYVLLANLYTEVEKWEAVKKLREKIGRHGLRKNPGCSWIEIKNKVHIFVSWDKSHPQSKNIELFLKDVRQRMKAEGYSLKKNYALIRGEDAVKEEALCGHSEKLAMAFGILNSPKVKVVRVVKNLRVCGDCHEAAKFMSKMVGRAILLRDSNRFHLFEEGRCSCRGYW